MDTANENGKRRPGTFVPGDPRINRTNGPGHKGKPWRLLLDMRAVYEQDESKDRGPAQKALRRLFNENLDAFLGRLGRLEQAFQAAGKEEKPAQAPEAQPAEPVDVGEQKAIELLEKLLREKPWLKAAEG